LVEDIEALRVHLGVPRISLLAHSFGVVLALEYAAKYPDRVEAAVLAGPLWNAPSSCNEHVERLAELRPDAYRTIMARPPAAEKDACRRNDGIFSGREREEITAANMFPNPATRELLQRLENESGLKNTGELGRAVFGQGLTRYKFEGADQVAAPVLVIGGSRDFGAGPRTQRELARLLPRGRFVEYEGIGHWMFLEEPDRFARDVTKFFDTASRQRR
jgi:proline iminopeptidase